MSVAAKSARFAIFRKAVQAQAEANIAAAHAARATRVAARQGSKLPPWADWGQRIQARTDKILSAIGDVPAWINKGPFKFIRLGYIGAAASIYIGYKATATWEESAGLGKERAPIMAWVTVPLTAMAVSASYKWTANGYEAQFWRKWPRTVPAALLGFLAFRAVVGYICPPDRSIEAEYFAWRDQKAKDARVAALLPEEKLTAVEMRQAQKLLASMEAQHANTSNDVAQRARVKEQSVYFHAWQQDKMNVANTKDVFEQGLLSHVAAASAVEESKAWEACSTQYGSSSKRCLADYNALQAATKARLAVLQSKACATPMKEAWKHFAKDLYAYDPKASVSTTKLRTDGEAFEEASKVLEKCIKKNYKAPASE